MADVDKECIAIKLMYDDGTEEVLKRGCAMSIGAAENSDDMTVKISFANGTQDEVVDVLWAIQRLAGVEG